MLKRLPLAAVVSLAIGIGATTAVFSVANALLLRPLTYSDPDRLAILWNRSPGLNIQEDWFSTAQYFDIKSSHSGLEQVAIALGANFNLTGGGDPERVGVIRVSSNLLPMLGATPLHGQLFVPEDDAPGRPPTAILGHGFWTRRFGGDDRRCWTTHHSQWRQLSGDRRDAGHVPVAARSAADARRGGGRRRVSAASAAATRRRRRERARTTTSSARLKPGVTVAQAQAEMDTLTARLRRDYPRCLSAARRPHVFDRAAARSGRRRRAARRSSCSSARSRSCCWWPARTSPTCCCHAPSPASASWRCARPSAPLARASSVTCSSESLMLSFAGGRAGRGAGAGPACSGCRRCSRRTCRGCATSASTGACCCSPPARA